ncbi:hypothetical protein Dsin_000810 [Dipteronia sinensis]|uniref:DUF4283 domain-containing protein n=1 Tax=Dipteronia sinensis TaxID=43782 RepID=A0AAE0B454_9ROSI|nr:hypothetical protein Dsin_000810 [Dipteronia sinensis]
MVARWLIAGLICWWEVPRCSLGVLCLEEYWHQKIIFDLAIGIRRLLLDKAPIEGDFGHFTRVLVDIDVSTVPPSSLPLKMDNSHSSFISVEYKNLSAFYSTCSFIGHFLNACRWNKSGKGIPVNSSKPDLARDSLAMVVTGEGFQDLGFLDSVVVHSSAGSDPVMDMVSSATLVTSLCLTSLVSPTTSVVAAQGPNRLMSDSQAELPLIVDSSWADQVEEEELDDTTTAWRSTRIAHRLASYKSGYRAFSRVSDD